MNAPIAMDVKVPDRPAATPVSLSNPNALMTPICAVTVGLRRRLPKLPALLLAVGLALPAAAASGTVYERLGGAAAVQHIVDELIERTARDPRTARIFEDVRLDRLKASIAEHMCAVTDGGCTYTGDDLALVHAGLGISEADFYILVEHLRDVLDEMGVSASAKNGLLGKLAHFKREVVE